PDDATKISFPSGDVSMPLLLGSSLPLTSSNPGLPGDHSKTAPVFFFATESANVFPGISSTVATSEPSANDATLFAARPSGISTQPCHVTVGALPEASTANTSMDSRAPCVTVYNVERVPPPGRKFRPCVMNVAAFGGAVQPGYFASCAARGFWPG